MKLLKGVTVSILLFLLCIVAPFNIHADSAVIVGTDVSLIDSTLLKSESYTESGGTVTKNQILYTYKVTAQLDNNYVGYLLLYMNYSYYNNPQSGLRTDSGSLTRRIFINGDTAEFTFTINTWYSTDPLLRNTTNATPNVVIQDQGVTLLSELDSIQQIIDILNDLYNSQDQVEGLLNNQLDQLELIVSNTSLANQYLDLISKFRQWNIEIESIPIVQWYLYKEYDYSIYNNSIINYPLFSLPSNTPILEFNNAVVNVFVGYIDRLFANPTDMANYFTFNDIEIIDIQRINEIKVNNRYHRLYKITFKRIGTGERSILTKSNTSIIPIYLGYNSSKNLSTDFALKYSLSNNLLDNLNIIANGTTQSNQQASDLSSGTDSMQQQMDDLIDQEDSYNDQMNNSINAIDFTSPVSQNAGILPAANFVITIFNGLIQNNAFSVLILIVCVLIIGKKVIGK